MSFLIIAELNVKLKGSEHNADLAERSPALMRSPPAYLLMVPLMLNLDIILQVEIPEVHLAKLIFQL